MIPTKDELLGWLVTYKSFHLFFFTPLHQNVQHVNERALGTQNYSSPPPVIFLIDIGEQPGRDSPPVMNDSVIKKWQVPGCSRAEQLAWWWRRPATDNIEDQAPSSFAQLTPTHLDLWGTSSRQGRRIFLEIDLILSLHSLNTSGAPCCLPVQSPPSAGASVCLHDLPLLTSSPYRVCKSLTPARTSPPVLCPLLGTHSTSST